MPSEIDEDSKCVDGTPPSFERKEAEGSRPSPGRKVWALIKKAFLLFLVLILLDGVRAPEQQVVTRVMAAMIEVYQRYVAEDILKKNNIRICRFTPSCSEYTKQALLRYGLYKGSVMGVWRIMRCNPSSAGGVDEP